MNHSKKILLVEDQEAIYRPLKRWLEDESYKVTLATTYQTALQAIDENHFHLAIIDIRLVHKDESNKDGLELILQINERKLDKIMPCVVLSANKSMDIVLRLFREGKIADYVQKSTEYKPELMAAIKTLFAEKIRINFDLTYDANSMDLVWKIAEDVNWSMSIKPNLTLLFEQVQDLIGRLFFEARRVHISLLKPGLTGAAIVRVQPTWEYGLGTQFVAKIGRNDKVKTEADRYKEYVERFLPPNTIAQIKKVVFSRHVGALQYTFAESDKVPLKEFDEYYAQNNVEKISESLRKLFQTTCLHWYDAREKKIEDLQELYFDAFSLKKVKLIHRIQVILPQFDPDTYTFGFDHLSMELLNPIAWLNRFQQECVLPMYRCITHGDLTGRNIMVDHAGKCWLIDFYRTHHSHILRDFVILETDIKYRLMKEVGFEQFWQLEELLLFTDESGEEDTILLNLSSDTRKAAEVVNMLRSTAYQFVAGGFQGRYQDSRREYLISLLMATLNVVRLRHIPESRKFQAMLSASLICAELDKAMGREAVRPELGKGYGGEGGETAVSYSAQQQFLAKKLKEQKLFLVLGSNLPPDASAQQFLTQLVTLPWHSIYTTEQQQVANAFQNVHQVMNNVPRDMQYEINEIPTYPLNGLLDKDETSNDHSSITSLPNTNSQQLISLMQVALQQGQNLLLLCATEMERKRLSEICYSPDAAAKMWVSGADIPEEVQDKYRMEGWRVLPDAPHDLLKSFAEIMKWRIENG